MLRRLTAFSLALALALTLRAADWPTFLGPTRDGVSAEKGIITPWPAKGLKKVWECDLGIGFAPPVTADGKLFHADRFDNDIRLTARDAATGKFLWKYEYPTEYEDRYGYEPGPRACPVVDGDRVYLYGPDGVLVLCRGGDRQGGVEVRHAREILLPPELLRRRQRTRHRRRPAHPSGRRQPERPAPGGPPRGQAERHGTGRVRQEDRRGEVRGRRRTLQLLQPGHHDHRRQEDRPVLRARWADWASTRRPAKRCSTTSGARSRRRA